MLKTVVLIVGSSFLLGLSAVGVQNYMLRHFPADLAAEKAVAKEKENSLLARLDFSQKRVDALQEYNEMLLLRNQQLVDSIQKLQVEISLLNRRVRVQQTTIQRIQAQLAGIETEYASLKSRIALLSRQENIDREKIAELEKEKAHLRLQISALNQSQEAEAAKQAEIEAHLENKRQQENHYIQLASILKETQIRYQRISVRKTKFGKPMSKINKSDGHWKYTILEFFMDHPNVKMLLDQQFVVKIVNADDSEILSFIEANPSFPQSKTSNAGVHFHFDGNLIEIAYHNNERKMGKNYELQIFYVSPEGKEYLLVNGIKPVISNRKTTGV